MKNRNQGGKKKMGGQRGGHQERQKSQGKVNREAMRSEAELGHEQDMGLERRE